MNNSFGFSNDIKIGIIFLIFFTVLAGIYFIIRKSNNTENIKYYLNRNNELKKYTINENSLVLIGNSIIEKNKWDKLFTAEYGYFLNLGISGEKIEQLKYRIEQVAIQKPRMIVIEIGINDLLSGNNPLSVFTEYEFILASIKSFSPTTNIIVMSILPVGENRPNINENILELNIQLKDLCKSLNVKFLDIFKKFIGRDSFLSSEFSMDGLHPNSKGYNLIEVELLKLIKVSLLNTLKNDNESNQ